MARPYGKLVLFGSGETSPTGRKIHRIVLSNSKTPSHIAILETPAGFQPNSALVAKDIADVFHHSLAELTKQVSIIPARKKGSDLGPDNQRLLIPLTTADYIFLGPGSPTYTVRTLRDSKAIDTIISRFKDGATLALSSAAAIAFGEHALPVYEIYKAGADLYWEKGLNILAQLSLSLSVVTHWNNTEGGEGLDTRYCYMGEERFERLRAMLPKESTILGIDEQTAVIFDFEQKTFSLGGAGTATLFKGDKRIIFSKGKNYDILSLSAMSPILSGKKQLQLQKTKKQKTEMVPVAEKDLPNDLQGLLIKRKEEKKKGNFNRADEIRDIFIKRGYLIQDIGDRQEVGIVQK